jgi:tripartite-type tricarboxylate transporter receptor subunit TctC
MREPDRKSFLQHCIAAALMTAMVMPISVSAQGVDNYPSKMVTVVVPFAAGGPTDNEGRLYTTRLSENLGQQFVLDFRPGAGNRIATQFVMKAPPDGYTLMYTASTHSVIPLMHSDLPYDLYKVLAPVSLLSKRYALMVVHPSVPVKNLAEYTAYAKANPGKLNLATAGAGGAQHLTGVWLNVLTGTQATMVHYKGTGAVMPDLLAGRSHVYFSTLLTAIPHLKSGKLRAIAQASLERNPGFPDLPTMVEGGLPGFEYSSWLGMLAPGQTPVAIRNRIAAEINRIVKAPDMVARMGTDLQLIGSTPAEFERYYLQEHERWKKLVKEANIRFE